MSAASTYEQSTVLELGARGKHRGAPFTLAGRTCVKSDGGGLWNEWTLAFDDGRQGFLAEALGAFTLFFERPMAPPYETLKPGEPLDPGFVVVERGHAKRIARWGKAWALTPMWPSLTREFWRKPYAPYSRKTLVQKAWLLLIKQLEN